ncbi:ParB N-terminal domain-containing protein [Stappia sp. F7233]|uniref:ParB N-terminal domain-containing protein n=2 Tax=Stappia albiluteola TaxID=2758565 RepID=A0A839AFA8_9HYPH|nr:ParB N-terminal domain-containing protein [Stappia albiluteola]MBA5777477.1 ParB N-terminal domain-containing protein [Stappia albiluteola]
MNPQDYQQIPVKLIDVPGGRRKVDPDWVAALAEDIGRQGLRVAIQLVEAGGRYRLIAGAHRLAAARALKWKDIPAEVKPADAFADEAAMKLAEIAENLMRRELSALDRAMDVAAWRDVYERAQGAVKPGRKKSSQVEKIEDADANTLASHRFSESFSQAAQRALGFSQPAVYRMLQIAKLDAETRERIALTKIADNQSSLLALVDLAQDLRGRVLDLLMSEPPQANSVAEAALLAQGKPAARSKDDHFKSTINKIRRLDRSQKFSLFDALETEIRVWAERRGWTA